ncbi:MAG: sigma-54-dependent transcriptional regulator [bacterium]
MPRLLVIDDDANVTRGLARLLEKAGHTVRVVQDARRALAIATEFQPDAVILDLAMPHRDGLDILPDLKHACHHAEVIIYTGAGNVAKAVQAMRDGAFDFVEKGAVEDVDTLVVGVDRALEVRRLREENAFLRRAYDTEHGPDSILVFSDQTRAVLELARRYRANPEVPVLIEGESGTGKELVARYIHHQDDDYARSFVPINCGAIPAELVEAELFGYVAGAFTGARADGNPGKIAAAEGGTLFLDELGELAPSAQVKFLRFLEHGTFFPVGGTAERSVHCRIVCATNRDLEQAVAGGDFRRDLYYRVLVGHIRIPPLRERRDEILPFARHFLREFADRFANPFEGFEPEAEDILLDAPWHGNVRELRNTIERVVLVSSGPRVTPDHLHFLRSEAPGPDQSAPTPAEAPLPEEGFDLERTMLRLIQRALEKHNYNQSRTARYLGITREALRYRMGKLQQS